MNTEQHSQDNELIAQLQERNKQLEAEIYQLKKSQAVAIAELEASAGPFDKACLVLRRANGQSEVR